MVWEDQTTASLCAPSGKLDWSVSQLVLPCCEETLGPRPPLEKTFSWGFLTTLGI